MKYKIESNYIMYGGIPSSEDWKIHLQDLTLLDAIEKMKNLLGESFKDIDIGDVYKTKEDSMGCYTMYRLSEDNTVDTIFKNLSAQEKLDLFDYATNWMTSEMSDIPDLYQKVEFYEN